MNLLEQRTLFGFDKLEHHLNSRGADISIGETSTTKHSPPLVSRLQGRIALQRQSAIMSEEACGGLFLFYGCEDEQEVARISLEFGELTNGGNYEALDIIFTRPVYTASGILIPKSRVSMYAEMPEQTGNLRCLRQDHLKKWGIWRKTDLRGILPDELFLTSKEIKYNIQHPYSSPTHL